MKRIFSLFLLLACMMFTISCQAFTKDMAEQRGSLRCGVSTGIPGFSSVDNKGNWSGLDVDICRAVAAAVFGDADKVTFVPLLPRERATALISGDVDILSRNFAWTLTRDSALNLNVVAVSFHDLQGFLADKKINVKSVLELKDFSVCLQAGTIYGETLSEYLQQSQIRYKTVVSNTPDQIVKDFESGRCEVITGGRAQLQGLRSKMVDPAETVFLPEIVTNVPLGPAVRHGDDIWFDIVKWSVFAMIYAEQLGLDSKNIDSMADSASASVQFFLGHDGLAGKGLGLSGDWAYQIVKQVGNYKEVFDRNLGEDSPLKLKRGLNRLWNQGGILFAPPFR